MPAALGDLIRWGREAAGLTQRALAERTGLSVRAIRDIERHRANRPRSGTLRRLAQTLELPPEVFDRHRSDPDPVWLGVLGPPLLRRHGRSVPFGSPQFQRLVGLLALNAGHRVSRDEIVDLLWPDCPPRTYANQVSGLVARLRTLIGRDGVVSDGTGYTLVPHPSRLDVAAFTEATTAADRASDAETSYAALGRALACWRGPVLGGADDRLRDHPAAVALHRDRIDTALRYAELAEALGHPGAAVRPLRDLADGEPLHEALHAGLIQVQAGAGDRGGALRTFERIRLSLAEELGVSVGRELRRAHRSVLASGEPPAQLPSDVHGFAGRDTELAALDQLWAAAGLHPTCVPVALLSGTAGVGKTALAVHWAHRVRDRFPDGQLFVNLRGFESGGAAVEPAEALRRMLDALDVPGRRIPPDLDGMADLYRTTLAGRRVLVVLDNARNADQVCPLLPGAPGCLVVVTSRQRLTDLVAAAAARPIAVGPLTAAQAHTLLVRRVGADRAGAEPAAVAGIIARCAGLPLALAVASARVATNPRLPLASIASGLVGGTGLHTVFSWSYKALSAPAQRLFRLLGLHPGGDATAAAAASLAGQPVDPELADLAEANLITEHAPGRYLVHDLLRDYARELAAAEETPADRDAALHRLLDHYLHAARTADRLLNPNRRHPDAPARRPGSADPPPLADPVAATAWFSAEYRTLTACVEVAGRSGHAWPLAFSLPTFFDRQQRWRDWVAVNNTVLATAGPDGDAAMLAQLHRGLGYAHSRLSHDGSAHHHFQTAIELFHSVDLTALAAHTHVNVAQSLDHHDHALAQARRGLALFRRLGDRAGQAKALNMMAWLQVSRGAPQAALVLGLRALGQFRWPDDRSGIAATHDTIGLALTRLGRHDEAVAALAEALRILHELGHGRGIPETTMNLGDAHLAGGAPDQARSCWRRALALLDDEDDPLAAEVRTRLRSVPVSTPTNGVPR